MAKFAYRLPGLITPFWLVLTAFVPPVQGTGKSPFSADGRREMVVVAPERFHKALAKFVAYRLAQRPTKLAVLESILKSTQGADDPERLKRWLYESWTASPLPLMTTRSIPPTFIARMSRAETGALTTGMSAKRSGFACVLLRRGPGREEQDRPDQLRPDRLPCRAGCRTLAC